MDVQVQFSFDFDTENLARKVLQAARQKAAGHMLGIACELQQEMGAEAAALKFGFDEAEDEPALGSSTAELGKLRISGPDESVCKRFAARLRERMRQ